jgi:hypothetical protein
MKYNILITAEAEIESKTSISAESELNKILKDAGITKIRVIDTIEMR